MSYYPAASEFQDIHLLISPLTRLRKVSRRLASKAPDATQHWAIKVDNFCYELKKEGLKGLLYREWKHENPGYFTPIKVGVTRESWSRLVVIVIKIWFDRFEQAYRFSTSNCQNFCYCFYKAICVDEKDSDITDDEYSTWQHFPKNLTEIAKSLQKIAGVCFLSAAALSRSGILPICISAPAVIATEVASEFIMKKTSKDKRYLGKSSIPHEKQDLDDYKDSLHATKRAMKRIRDPDSAQKKIKIYAKNALQIIEAFEEACHQGEAFSSSEYDSESGEEDDKDLPFNTHNNRVEYTNHNTPSGSYDDCVYSSESEDRYPYSSQSSRRLTYNNSRGRSSSVREEEDTSEDSTPSRALAPYKSGRAQSASDWSEWSWNRKRQQWSSYRFVNGEYEYTYREAGSRDSWEW